MWPANPVADAAWNEYGKVLDAQHGTDLAATRLVRTEDDQPTGDPAVDEVFDAIGTTYRFYLEVFERDLMDGRTQPLTAIVHYGTSFLNCFWDGERLIVGDGGRFEVSAQTRRPSGAVARSLGLA